MSESNKKESPVQKIIVGVAIVVVPVLIFYYLGIDPKNPNRANGLSQGNEIERVVETNNVSVNEINYVPFVGIYRGESLNTSSYQKGKTIFNVKEINNSTRKVKVEAAWYDGLYGEGRLFGEVDNYKIELQGSIHSETTGSWDIEMVINLNPGSRGIDGYYKLFPLVGNSNGTQNGKFDLVKER